jgi:uncharacterized membrane protein YkoI
LKLLICVLTVLTVTAAAAVFVTYSYSGYLATAQANNTSTRMTQNTANITKKQQQEQQQVNITGSIPIQSTISQALRSEIQVAIDEALTIAQNTVGTNSSSVVAAFLSPLKGFLVYNIGVISANNTLYKVIVDPGNGQVLYTSEGRQIGSINHLVFGPFQYEKGYDGSGSGHGKGEFGHKFSGGGLSGHWKGHAEGYGQDGGGFWHNR